MSRLLLLHRHQGGASSAEFALVVPLLILFLFGMIDVGRFMWEYNQAEKATQMGVRYAVATDMVPSGLETYSFAVDGGIAAGNPVPVANFASATCTQGSCTCAAMTGNFCGSVGYNGTAFNNIVDRMNDMYQYVGAQNVEIEYRNVGLGYAGDPDRPDVEPLVTVKLRNMTFQPFTGMLFGASVTMPDFRASLTAEDGDGSVAN